MPRVNTMDFSTRGWTKLQPDGATCRASDRCRTVLGGAALHRVWRWCLGLLLLLACLVLPARAADLQQLSLTRNADGVFLSASVNMELAPSMEDALSRAVPLYFVVQADVLRERWYWSDKRLGGASRTYRLAYQPLTRHWRVSVAAGSGPGGALQYALHQNHDSLAAALLFITKLSGWQVAEAGRIDGESDLMLDFRFKLDLALLPRPFQLGMNAQNEWSLDVRRRVAVPALSTTESVPVETAGEAKPDAGTPAPLAVPSGAAGKAP